MGQLFIVGFDGTELTPRLAALLTRIQPAGIVLFARNILFAGQTYKLIRDCQSCVRTPLFACVDLEGGSVDRLRDVLGATPSAAEVFATGDRALFRKHGKTLGEACRALGFNTDFAPVVDLAFPSSHSVMGSRVISSNPKKVVVYAREFLAGLGAARVIGAAKHFPGLGEANLDTHQELPSVRKEFKRLWEEDIYPYRVLRSKLPMIMVSHANYRLVTRDDSPASLSKKWITEILRRKIGYRGLIVSDDLEMGGVLKAAPIEEAAIQFIRAGGDICLICHIEAHVVKSFEAVVAEAKRDKKFMRRVIEASDRVLDFKRKNSMLRRTVPPTAEKVQKLSRKLWEFSEQVRLQRPDTGETLEQGQM